MLNLNELAPVEGSKKAPKRVGRGIGSGLGKTGGRGHKGQKARSGGFHKTGFEGGQMPLQRRLPKVGFRSRKQMTTAEVRLDVLANIDADIIDLNTLKDAGAVPANTLRAKVINSGELKKAVKLKGLVATKGAQTAIESAGGTIEE